MDAAGNAYVAGTALSGDHGFPTVNPAFPPAAGNAFLLKFNPSGTALLFSTRFGGDSTTTPKAIALDSWGNAYVVGTTFSTNFPTTEGAFQRSRGGGWDAFVMKFNAAGTAVLYSTHLGGSGYDEARAIAVDPCGNAYIGGYTNSANFPSVRPLQTSYAGVYEDAFVTHLNAGGTALVYSTTLGGQEREEVGQRSGPGCGLDPSRGRWHCFQEFPHNVVSL